MTKGQKNITKADMISEIAGRTGLSKADIRVIIEEFMQLIRESVLKGFSVQIRGFGTFFRKKRASKTARNISKGTSIEIPAHEIPAYKPSKSFTNSVKGQRL